MIRNGQEVFSFLSIPINGDHALLGPQGKIADSVVPDSHLENRLERDVQHLGGPALRYLAAFPQFSDIRSDDVSQIGYPSV